MNRTKRMRFVGRTLVICKCGARDNVVNYDKWAIDHQDEGHKVLVKALSRPTDRD